MHRPPRRFDAPPIRPSSADPRASRANPLRTACWYAAAGCCPFYSSPISAESPGDIVFRLAPGGVREYLLGLAIFDQVAGVHEGGHVGAARGLLHVMGHDNDSVRRLKFQQ